jgi:VWFA-related protein
VRHSWPVARGAVALALMLVATSSVRPAGQAPAPDGSPVSAGPGDLSLPAIRIDAIVTDRHGRPVLNLRPSDLELFIDGVVRPLERVNLRIPAPTSSTAPGPAAETPVARHAGTRVFAFLLDEFHVGPGVETERVRESMLRFIDEHFRPTDLAAVLKPLDHVTAIRFTHDRQVLRDAVASFAGRKGDFTPRTEFEEQFIGRAPATVTAARVQLVTVALNELAMQLGELNADRAAVVLFSEGFERSAPVRRGSRLIDMQGLLRAASRFHFAVYAFNPADLPPAAADGTREPAGATLNWLAVQTGGAAVLDGTNIESGLARMSGELDTYYALELPQGVADGRFHPIEVRAKRAGLSVRARPGYWAPLSSEVRAWLRRMSAPASNVPRRALKRSALIDVWVGLVPRAEGQQQMILTWEPPRPGAARARPTVARIDLSARTASGTTLFEGSFARSGEPHAPGEAARFDVPAERVEIDMRLFGANGVLLDSDIRDVTVPDVNSGKANIVLSPQIIRARTMNEFRAAIEDPVAVPTASRSFARSDRLVIRVPGWATAREPVTTGVRLLNRVGQEIRTLELTESAGIPQFELPLAWLAPGEYYLEFSGRTERLESRERIPIRITG